MGRFKRTLVAGATFAMALGAAAALAGPYSDEMAKCLVKSTSAADRNALVRWIFAAAAQHPEVKSIVSVSEPQRDELNRTVAKLFETLLTQSCKAETQNAVKYEGRAAFEGSFQVLGQVAGREMFSNPAVSNSMADLAKYIDKQKLENVLAARK